MTRATERAGEPHDAIGSIVASARRLGVEIDEAEAARWLDAMASEAAGGDVVVDVDSGVYGHRITMLDFTPAELARFRAIGQIVGFEDRPGQVLTALALSGSAAQGRIQSYPGGCDYFERVHILAPTRDEACHILADLVREKALATAVGPTHRLCAEFDTETMLAQADELIMSAIGALEGKAEVEMVRHLLRVRDSLVRSGEAAARSEDVREVTSTALEAVNAYFRERLVALPEIRAYLDGIAASGG